MRGPRQTLATAGLGKVQRFWHPAPSATPSLAKASGSEVGVRGGGAAEPRLLRRPRPLASGRRVPVMAVHASLLTLSPGNRGGRGHVVRLFNKRADCASGASGPGPGAVTPGEEGPGRPRGRGLAPRPGSPPLPRVCPAVTRVRVRATRPGTGRREGLDPLAQCPRPQPCTPLSGSLAQVPCAGEEAPGCDEGDPGVPSGGPLRGSSACLVCVPGSRLRRARTPWEGSHAAQGRSPGCCAGPSDPRGPPHSQAPQPLGISALSASPRTGRTPAWGQSSAPAWERDPVPAKGPACPHSGQGPGGLGQSRGECGVRQGG